MLVTFQRRHRLLYMRGHFLQKETEANRNFVKCTMHFNLLKKKCKRKVQGIHDRFLKDHDYNSRPFPIGITNKGSWHRVHPLQGGNGKTLGRRDPLLTVFRRKLQKMVYNNSICLVTDKIVYS